MIAIANSRDIHIASDTPLIAHIDGILIPTEYCNKSVW